MSTVIFFKSLDSFEQPVVGESSYQSAIKNAHESEGKFIDVDLQLEDENKFDKNAVLIAYGTDTLGYLPREDALMYRNALQKLGHPRAVGVCKAKIIGGNGKHYGIILDVDIAEPQVEKISVPNPQAQPTSSSDVPPISKTTVLPKPAAKNNFFKNLSEFWGKGLINKVVLSIVVIVLACSFFSCVASLFSPGASAEPTQDPNAISTNAMLTAWAPFTQTAAALPTNTSTPENTPTPQSTPTNTPPPTTTPAPIVLTGSGDMIIDVPEGGEPRVLHARYSSGGNFVIRSYDASNQPIDLLVNTIGAYDGKVPLDMLDDEFTSRLEIKASGPWEITLIPLVQARTEVYPGVFQGNGDDVIIVIGNDNADTIKADASNASSNFVVFSYSNDRLALVFNEIAPYTGTALIDSTTFLITVKAEGNWSLELTAK